MAKYPFKTEALEKDVMFDIVKLKALFFSLDSECLSIADGLKPLIAKNDILSKLLQFLHMC